MELNKTELNSFLTDKGYTAVPFTQNGTGHLLIHVTVNDVRGLFILDTGAGGSVIESLHAEYLKLELQEDSRNFSGAGAGGGGMEVVQSNGNSVEIGDYKLTDSVFWVMSLEHVRQGLAQLGSTEEFLGIIGVDILKPGKAVIDYDGMMLYLLKTENQ